MQTLSLAFSLESLILSMVLAYIIIAINDSKVFALQTNNALSLDILVKEKTKVLESSLLEKDILYKELNHRIKNNLMMIISLVKLQIIKDEKQEVKDALITTKHRIESIVSLYETLLLDKIAVNISSLNYFKNISNNIKIQGKYEVEVVYDIQINLEVNTLIYAGLVLNELMTNALKYAFQSQGIITISLYQKEEEIIFIIADDGKGFVLKDTNSLGLLIVRSLIEGQLKGSLDISSEQGTKVCMSWKNEGMIKSK